MMFVYNPKNFLYAKVSMKQRKTTANIDSTANYACSDTIYSFKLGSRFARLASAEPLMNNLIAKTSTELIASEY